MIRSTVAIIGVALFFALAGHPAIASAALAAVLLALTWRPR